MNIIVEEKITIDDDDLILISDDESESMTVMSSSIKSNSNLVIQDLIKTENDEFSMKVEKLSLTEASCEIISVIELDDSMKITDECVDIPQAKVESVDDTVTIDNLELSFEMKDLSSSSRNTSFCEEATEESTISTEKEDVTLSNEVAKSESEENNILTTECDFKILPLKEPVEPVVNVSVSPEIITCENIPSTSKNIPLKTKVNINEVLIFNIKL